MKDSVDCLIPSLMDAFLSSSKNALTEIQCSHSWFLQQTDELSEKLARLSEHGVTNRKTMKAQSFPLLEEALFVGLLQQREANIIVQTNVLRAKAEYSFVELQKRGFYADKAEINELKC